MKRLLTTTLCAAAAGFVGGIASQATLSPQVVHAQTAHPVQPPAPERSAANQLTSQRFTMVDPQGHVRGEIKLENGNPEIVLYAADGQVAWKAPTGPHLVY